MKVKEGVASGFFRLASVMFNKKATYGGYLEKVQKPTRRFPTARGLKMLPQSRGHGLGASLGVLGQPQCIWHSCGAGHSIGQVLFYCMKPSIVII